MKKIKNILIKQATKTGWIECEMGGVADLSYPTSKLDVEESRATDRLHQLLRQKQLEFVE